PPKAWPSANRQPPNAAPRRPGSSPTAAGPASRTGVASTVSSANSSIPDIPATAHLQGKVLLYVARGSCGIMPGLVAPGGVVKAKISLFFARLEQGELQQNGLAALFLVPMPRQASGSFHLPAQLKRNLALLQQAPGIGCLAFINHGLEKESLRVDPNGHIAQTAHPAGLGSALTHPCITTDFSEALMEFITPVFNRPEDSLAYLQDIHTFIYTQLHREELLWT